MKKLMATTLGLGLALGTAVFAQTPAPADQSKTDKTATTKPAKAHHKKSSKKKAADTTTAAPDTTKK